MISREQRKTRESSKVLDFKTSYSFALFACLAANKFSVSPRQCSKNSEV